MKLSIGRAGIALITFVIGLSAVASWYGQRKRVTIKVDPVIVSKDFDVPPTENPPPGETTTIASESRQSKYLQGIEIVQHDTERTFTQMKFENTAAEKIDVDLDLGDDIENQLIILRPSYASREGLKIEQQFETSFQVYGEGPHVDLTEWKHYRSPWRELRSIGDNMFLTQTISEAEASRFPAVTKAQIYRAVLNAGDERWAEEARTCKTLTSAPCSVGVSRISFRIKVKEEGRWKVVNRLNFMIPMGC
jgi:hypothetical protein